MAGRVSTLAIRAGVHGGADGPYGRRYVDACRGDGECRAYTGPAQRPLHRGARTPGSRSGRPLPWIRRAGVGRCWPRATGAKWRGSPSRQSRVARGAPMSRRRTATELESKEAPQPTRFRRVGCRPDWNSPARLPGPVRPPTDAIEIMRRVDFAAGRLKRRSTAERHRRRHSVVQRPGPEPRQPVWRGVASNRTCRCAGARADFRRCAGAMVVPLPHSGQPGAHSRSLVATPGRTSEAPVGNGADAVNGGVTVRDADPPLELFRTPPSPFVRLLKPNEVAEELGVSRSWVYAAADDGRLPSVRLGGPDGPLRFVPEDLHRWLQEARANWRPGRQRRATR
jgi:excisionase family DNA binding protein